MSTTQASSSPYVLSVTTDALLTREAAILASVYRTCACDLAARRRDVCKVVAFGATYLRDEAEQRGLGHRFCRGSALASKSCSGGLCDTPRPSRWRVEHG